VTEVTYAIGKVCLMGTFHFQQTAAPFLLSCTLTFDLSCTQSLATITIVIYGTKTTEDQHGSVRELRHKQMLWGIKHLS